VARTSSGGAVARARGASTSDGSARTLASAAPTRRSLSRLSRTPAGVMRATAAPSPSAQALLFALSDRSPGRPLEPGVRREVAAQYGADFPIVRIHADGNAAALAGNVQADAFTRGDDVYFGAGRFDPGTVTGRALLRHELGHVLQQRRGEVSAYAGRLVPENHESEKQAASGEAFRGPHAKGSPHVPNVAIQRSPSGSGPTFSPTKLPSAEELQPGMDFKIKMGEGFGAEFRFRATAAAGDATVGGSPVGQGTFAVAEPGSVVAETTAPLAEGTVEVGTEVVAQRAALVPAETAVAPAVTELAVAAGLTVLGAIVTVGAVYLVVEALSHSVARVSSGEEYPGTLWPGGVPEVLQTPGIPSANPAGAPGQDTTPLISPGAAVTPVRAPGAEREPLDAPGMYTDDPATCARLMTAGPHHHHLFPVQYRHLFHDIFIDVDDHTVELEPWQHIGKRGVHATLDWNERWAEFFDNMPDLADADYFSRADLIQLVKWRTKAIELLHTLMHEAGIDQLPVVPYPEWKKSFRKEEEKEEKKKKKEK